MRKKSIKVTIRIFVIIIICLLALMFIGQVVNHFSKRGDASLILEKVEINGSKQWISISEEPSGNKKPVILFLHGGPGSANISLLRQLCAGIEEHAVVVNWDQRNAGKSFSIFQSKGKLSFGQNLQDAHVLTNYLKEKYEVDKITLMGFSAGTALGIMLVDKYPEDYELYISVAQMVDGQRGELMSLEYTLQKARENKDVKAVTKLEGIQFDFSKPESILSSTQNKQKYLLRYGGVYHTYHSYSHEMNSLWQSKEYNFVDFLFWPLASLSSLKAMWHEVVLLKIDELVPKVEVPVVFFSGAYDMNCPTSLVKEYYEGLEAPKGKELILFENSAHGVFWDEPERFTDETVKALQKYTGFKE